MLESTFGKIKIDNIQFFKLNDNTMDTFYSKTRNLPFYLLTLTTMGISGFEKLFSFEIPKWYIEQFSGSIIDFFPNALTIMWVMIMILQISAFLFTLLAIIKKEFRDEVQKNWSQIAFLLTEISFVILGFGQRIIQNYDVAFWLFAYAVLTFLGARAVLKKNYEHSATS
ncbi:hypothetical protein [Parapedobacter soli]|uniref:hypothetical protein n=1 Tax=Parapedobacter soli TaxID=416955 RepID=UPI0021C76BEA|nr:hypothetical protein [Parapedobacter soli]